jgi:ribosomal protein S18 acetylase RimI-like enzyme
MTDQPTIRRATAADADAVMAMVLAIAAHENDTAHVTTTTERWRELLARPEVVVLLAEDGHRPVGYVSAVRSLHLWSGGDILRLDDLYVDAAHRNGGVGRALMAAMARVAADEELLVRWEVLPDNDGGQRFYRRLGATLRHKVVALWHPEAYATHL